MEKNKNLINIIITLKKLKRSTLKKFSERISMELKTLFSSGKIGNIQIKNRIVRSATWEARATEDGHITDELINFYEELANGGSGLLITGFSAVHPSGAATRCMNCIYDDSYILGHKKLVSKVHDISDVKISVQIVHTGSRFYTDKCEPIGPSPLTDPVSKRTARELSLIEIEEIIESFAEAGRRAYESEYDMVQLHAAHGFLLSDFISPFSNKRKDEYGGNTQSRVKIILEIFNRIRDKVGKNFPIIIKLNTIDYVKNGLTIDDGKEIAKMLVNTGFAAIEPSCGRIDIQISKGKTYPSVIVKSEEDENYFLPNAKLIKSITKDCPIILMGGVRNPNIAEDFLKKGIVDFISMSRPLIYEPDLPNRWKNGDLSLPLCNYCSACLGTGLRGPVHCIVRKKLEKKKQKK